MRRLLIILATLAIAASAMSASAGTQMGTARAVTVLGGAQASGTSSDVGATATVPYTHRDCVGPNVAGTPGAHQTHTENVGGLRIGGGIVRFSLSTLALEGPGICPTGVRANLLPEDFTGTWRMKAVCRGVSDGTVMSDWEVSAVAGVVQSQGSDGAGCSGPSNAPFSLDVTISISGTSFQNIPLQALGGVRLTITQ